MGYFTDLTLAYRMRWKRRRYLFRAFRSRRQLETLKNQTENIKPDDILSFSTVRNEILRLPYFLEHNRSLGVDHFIFVDNSSDDGTLEFLLKQPDVSVWKSTSGYKQSRFGVDWLNWLQTKYARNRWCLTLDVDELFIYPHWESRDLKQLTDWLDQSQTESFGAIMIDLYPKGRMVDQHYVTGDDPIQTLNWFDPEPLTIQRQLPMRNLWVQGGVRASRFFANTPERAPTINKIPLTKWRLGFVYMNSTHSMLPPRLNAAYVDFDGQRISSGALLHTKFLPDIAQRSKEEKARKQHFGESEFFDPYYDQLIENPDLWHQKSLKFEGWQQLEALGLIDRGAWT